MKPAVTITKGSSGWGGPLTVCETETRKVVASVTLQQGVPLSRSCRGQQFVDPCRS